MVAIIIWIMKNVVAILGKHVIVADICIINQFMVDFIISVKNV